MAVFPILLVTCLRLGVVAGWICLIGGLLGAWYVYLGERFSFVVNGQEARSLVTALIVGVLIIGVCLLLRSSNIRLQATNAASLQLAKDLEARTVELGDLNAALSRALGDHTSAEEALLLSEAQFRASFEEAAVGKVQSDAVSGRIIRVNRAFAAMLGYEPIELVGRNGWELTLDDDREAEQAAYEAVLDGQRPAYIREKRYVRRDGVAIWGRVSATVTRSPKTGEPVLTVAVIENIDEQYKAKVALVAAKQDLELLLEERTVTLAQRDVLLREVYHRVKNNLQIIDSLLVMQRARLTDPQARAALTGLRSRVFALGLVHHQLMGSSDLKTFEIAPFLEELSNNILQGAAAKGVSIAVHAMPLTVGLDFAIPLGLIMTELVTNSLKHAFPSRGGEIQVSLERGSDDVVILKVSDDGVGSNGDVPRIEPPTTSLGMTIVEALVKQMGGRLDIRRDQGSHTEIHVPGPRSE
jgi:PAS domain S-box-containing protein